MTPETLDSRLARMEQRLIDWDENWKKFEITHTGNFKDLNEKVDSLRLEHAKHSGERHAMKKIAGGISALVSALVSVAAIAINSCAF